MTLSDWLALGWLTEHSTSPEEIADLLALARRDLDNSAIAALDPDWSLSIAYNAALQLATAALAACGYRASREAHHYRVVESLSLTIGLEPALVQQLDQFRRKRNLLAYERAGLTSRQEADAMRALAAELYERVSAWLSAQHPGLLAP
jgi:hypothetical protein